jgi:hypothetical protein
VDEQNGRQEREWHFYRDPESLKVCVGRVDTKQLELIFERSDGIEIGECPDLSGGNLDTELLYKVLLYFYIDEIPRLIAIVNEIYREHYEAAVPYLMLDDEDDYGELDERLATLRAYKVVADQLSDHVQKLGLLAPME